MSETRAVTLTEFLLARIAEDEAARLDVRRFPYPFVDIQRQSARRREIAEDRRVFLEAEAKRRIVAALADADAAVAKTDPDNLSAGDWQEWGNRHAWHEAACILATVYADHPDYDEAWKP